MAWTYAKTDWSPSDDFQFKEYNRIKDNIESVIKLSEEMYKQWQRPQIKAINILSIYFAEVFNNIEENIRLLAENTFKPISYEQSKYFHGNEDAWNFADINRIERTCLLMNNILQSQKDNRRVLSFTLGGDYFG